jgi:peptide/nickel transport system permease protein
VISDSDEFPTTARRRPISVFGRLGAAKRSTRRGAWTVGRLVTAAYLLLLLVVVAFPAPFAPHSPDAQDLAATLRPPVWGKGGSTAHLLGTDDLGRDLLSRIIYGARTSLVIAIAAVVIAALIGVAAGTLSGYRKGLIDSMFMRLADAQLSIPFILLAIGVVGAIGPSGFHLALVLALTGWVVFARVARAESLRLREAEFVYLAKGMGARTPYILFRHLLPNSASPLIVIAVFQVSTMVFSAAALSFLGLGVQDPTPDWGSMMGEGRNFIYTAWWLITLPGVALAATILALNVLGQWLSDVRGGG